MQVFHKVKFDQIKEVHGWGGGMCAHICTAEREKVLKDAGSAEYASEFQ